MKVKKIKHPKELELTEIEGIEFQLNWTLRTYKLNATEISTLAYVFLYGNDAPINMVQNGLSKREKSIENIITTFRKKGLIQGKGVLTKLHPGLITFKGNFDFTIKVRINDKLDKEL